jgi:Ribbon-helix-helix protein, copG family.
VATKKSFKNENPALRFISHDNNATEEQRQSEPPALLAQKAEELPMKKMNTANPGVPMKRNPLYIETRSRRLNLLIQPSLHNRIKELARAKDSSVNDLIHVILEEYADREKL